MQNDNVPTASASSVVTWKTNKTADGYSFTVFAVEYQKPAVTLKTGTRPSRAAAVTLAKKWVRFHKATQRQAVAA